MKRLLLLFILICTAAVVFSQKKDSTWKAAANGMVRDSVHNYALPAATLAVYLVKDSSLISYQLSDNFGEFHFKDLPVNQSLRIVVSYMGYQSLAKKFTISGNEIDLKQLNLERGENSLKGIEVIAVPPVQMNGDTLEFNADAFRLDPIAQTEDLLRVLPGVTFWGDGTITVNGKEVRSVLVDGKPFFGGDKRVATQNIPKDAVDKIQVYQQNKNRDNPLDSVTEVNIKLKANKRMGHFGKVSAGYGSRERYEADASINFFSPKTQIGFVAASNNINKDAADANELLRNSTFKGVGAGTEYQSDFSMQGISRPQSGGFVFQHDFIPDRDYNKENRLNASYFLKNNINDQVRNTQTVTSLGGDSSLIRDDRSNIRINNTAQHFQSRYDKRQDNNRFYVGAAFNSNTTQSNSRNESSVFNTARVLQSTNQSVNDNNSDGKNLTLEIGTSHQSRMYESRRPRDYEINYSFIAANSNNDRWQQTTFNSIANPAQNKLFDRRYNTSSNDTKQHLSLKWGDLSPWMFTGNLSRLSIQLQNNLDVNTHGEKNEVRDKDPAKDNYVLNQYLTNDSRYTTINEKPALNFSRTFNKGLENRYNKTVTIDASAQAQFYQLQNYSDHAFQNLSRSYLKFVPNAGIRYQNNQYGDFYDTYSLNFAATNDYPAVFQLAPLVDSSNLYYIRNGNATLKPAEKRVLTFSMSHYTVRTNRDFNYNGSVSAGIVNNSFADSSMTDKEGRSSYYVVNADGHQFLSISGNLNKAFKLRKHQLQLSVNIFDNFSRTPNSIGGVWNKSDNINSNNNLRVYYSYKDIFNASFNQGFNWYKSRRHGIEGNDLSNRTYVTAFSASVNCTRRLSVSSNVNFNRNTSTGSGGINYAIWNANAAYRFMKGNNFELKLSAMDLLHQNTSIINYGYNNTLTYGTANVLQQYFMATVSWFPRKFGKSEQAKETVEEE
ncbi:hypothetical protein [Chitinophaga sp. RAB17]|uniref:hypothetical protein n=1 Tax=Chitinophaga sp. RAB17 TaxID=3233049 RepID=UPI003F93746B